MKRLLCALVIALSAFSLTLTGVAPAEASSDPVAVAPSGAAQPAREAAANSFFQNVTATEFLATSVVALLGFAIFTFAFFKRGVAFPKATFFVFAFFAVAFGLGSFFVFQFLAPNAFAELGKTFTLFIAGFVGASVALAAFALFRFAVERQAATFAADFTAERNEAALAAKI